VHLFSNELATYDNIRDEVDLGIELPVVCDLANEFLHSVPLPKPGLTRLMRRWRSC
jgi:hypothetical protein